MVDLASREVLARVHLVRVVAHLRHEIHQRVGRNRAHPAVAIDFAVDFIDVVRGDITAIGVQVKCGEKCGYFVSALAVQTVGQAGKERGQYALPIRGRVFALFPAHHTGDGGDENDCENNKWKPFHRINDRRLSLKNQGLANYHASVMGTVNRSLPNGARVLLAPLCGITTAPFRRICQEHGADMVVTEMVSSDAMTRGRHAHCRALRGLEKSDSPQSVQIFGADPERMSETAAILSETHRPEYIDMNFGCPVKKIVTRNGGSGVLRDLDLLFRICRAVVKRSAVPVSAKIRAGWDKPTGEGVRDIVRAIEDAGVSMVAVHARTKKQGFSGAANWDLIAAAKAAASIPVVGNGDVKDADDVVAMQRQTGCDAVMIGRGAIGNPWIFAEVRARLSGGTYRGPTTRERVEVLLHHVAEAVRLEGEPAGLINMRKVMAAYVKHLPNARELRGTLMHVVGLAELEDVLSAYLESVESLAA